MRLNPSTILLWLRRGAFALGGLFLTTLFGLWLAAVADQNKWFENPNAQLEAAMNFASGILASEWFHWLGGAILGFGGGVWLDTFLRRRVEQDETTHSLKSAPEPFTTWFNQSAELRAKFMSKIVEAFEKWRMTQKDASEIGSFERIIDGVTFPIPEISGRYDIGKVAVGNRATWDYASRTLFRFCASVYPRGAKKTMDKSIDEQRRELSKAWDNWGRKAYNRETIEFGQIENVARNQSRLLKVLSLLELAQCVQQDTLGPGKTGLFFLCRKASDS